MKAALIAAALTMAVLLCVCVKPVFSADADNSQQGQRQSLEQKKAEILQHIEERNALGLKEKACVQGAATHDELRTCREKFRPQRKEERQEKRS